MPIQGYINLKEFVKNQGMRKCSDMKIYLLHGK